MASGKLLHKLEAIRGFAAMYVLVHHVLDYNKLFDRSIFFKLFFFGQEVVMLFFILSGFVIQYSFLLSKDRSFKTFFFKRFNRIYIPLIIVMLTQVIIVYLQNGFANINPGELAGNLLMLQDMPRVPRTICEPFLGNHPLWSLSYEWWFYMIFFAMASLFKQKFTTYIYIAGILATVSYIVFPFWGNRIFIYLMLWNLGASVALLYINNQQISLKNMMWPLLAVLLVTGLLALNYFLNKQTIHAQLHVTQKIGINKSPFIEFRHFLSAFLLLFTGIIWHKLRWRGFKQTIGLFEFLAPISYCLYICHFFLMIKSTYLDFIDNVYLRTVLYFLICVAYSYCVERLIYPKVNKFIIGVVFKKKPIAT